MAERNQPGSMKQFWQYQHSMQEQSAELDLREKWRKIQNSVSFKSFEEECEKFLPTATQMDDTHKTRSVHVSQCQLM